MVSRYFLKKKSQKIGPAAHFPATEKKLFFPIPLESRGRLLTATSGGKNMADIECRRGRNYAYFINFVPYFGQLMSVYRHKCLARCLIVTKTSFHAGFWCLSRIKRSTRSPNRKTFGDVCHLWLPFSALLGTCGLLSRAANLWSETNFFRDSNPCGLHSRASYCPTNIVYINFRHEILPCFQGLQGFLSWKSGFFCLFSDWKKL